VYRLLLAAHVVVSSGWLGIAFAKLVLGLAALTSDAPTVSRPLYLSMEAVNVVFPPAAIATLVTGILLSLGTRWSLLEYYWVATKLVLSVGVIATGIALMDRLILRSIPAPSEHGVGDGAALLSVPSAPTLLVSWSATHVLMLGVTTVLSVYKPWGKIPPIWRKQRATRDPERTGLRYG
jgi:hypothetical protein